jgi:hypothetical protein
VTDLNAAVLGGRRLAEVESFTFVSNDNKFEVEAFLTKPIGPAAAESATGIAQIPADRQHPRRPARAAGSGFVFKNQVTPHAAGPR